MGGIVQGAGSAAGGGVGGGSNSSHPLAAHVACLQAQVAHLTKLVHSLYTEAQQVAEILHIDGDGLHITAGPSSFKVLRSGILVNGVVQGSGAGSFPAGPNMPRMNRP